MKNQSEDRSKYIDCSDDDDVFVEKPQVQDEYGCVAYMPVQPSSDVLASQEENRLKLIDIFNSTEENINDNVINIMNTCYYLQRKNIHKENELSIIFERWPYFHHYQLIVKHADQLLGKDVSAIWMSSMNKLSKPINCWLKNVEIASEINKAKKKVSQPDEEKKYVRKMLRIAQKYSNTLKNDEPYHTVTLGLIVKFMKENLNFLYIITNEELADEELLEEIPVVNPVLTIRGRDLHNDDNVYNVVINKKTMIHVPSFTEGILTTFLCYYVFGFVYPPPIEGTLEAIQR
ncbi:hypothetical protein PV327_008789 [Microctonus hyperodae]|uniref:Uncharacterized protein n=1 Tax=Microctonus hyperodae TaxID=165561 RepID=A0AA39FSG8_MICHY|nr:hypothetical protein PV327_008789 [Microctonus hyperodae]